MQIGNSTTPIPFVPVTVGTGTSSSTASSNGTDTAVLNISSATFSTLVNEAKSYPEVRGEVVDAYKARIANGSYPSEEVVEGLINLMGGLVE